MWPHYVIVCLVLCLQLSYPCSSTYSEDNGPPPPEMARKHGYHCDVHNVTTEDGYILQVHRLPGGRLQPLNCSLPPIIVMHGIFCSSADFFLAGPSQGLSYLLADRGYDVWLPNSRGNTYSRDHVDLSTEDNHYWNFSWHEIGIYDLPAIIDYVLQTTGHHSVLYVGASMGTTVFFVMCSERPEYNSKVQYMVALAPVAYLNHITSVSRLMTPIKDELDKQIEVHSHGEMFGRSSPLVTSLVHICRQRFNKIFCDYAMFQILGSNPSGTNMELTQEIYAYIPAGGSANSMLHFGQLINTNYFRKFDYGSEGENLAVYGSPIPPSYDLSLITVPMAFFYGDNDAISNPKDVRHLVSVLNDVQVYRDNVTRFSHLDFVLAKDVKQLVYDKLISLLQTNQRQSDSTVCGG